MTHNLTPEQEAILDKADKAGRIEPGDDRICPGIHFCSDWDGMAICIGCPEMDVCECGALHPSPA
jgi:hypothetical protein